MKINLKKIEKIVNEITLYSAAMSFYTIFALIPIILIVLSIFASSPFFSDFYAKLEEFISSNILPSNQKVVSQYLKNFLSNSSKMGIIGAFYIFITSILFFDNYETIIAKILNKEKRNLWEKIKLYWTMLTLFPLLFAGGMYFSIKAQLLLEKSELTSWINLLSLLPFFMIWISFFLAYKLTLFEAPTKKTLIVSFLVTFLFFIAKTFFVYYILINKTYSTIYGSISLLMFIFLWIYINWIIYIFGVFLIKINIDLKKKN